MSELTNVLLVDDNPKYLKDALPFYGYNVTTAENGAEALKILSKKNGEFDIVLLEILLPVLNGWETLKIIRNTPATKDVPVIMVTSVNEEQKIVTSLKIGADDYVVKPYILPNLLARMEAVLRRSNRSKTNPAQLDFNPLKTVTSLTAREKEILSHIAKGASNKDVAEKLFLREVTVKSHLNNIYKKLNVTSRTQALLISMQMNLIEN